MVSKLLNNRFNNKKELDSGVELAEEFSNYKVVHRFSMIEIALTLCHATLYEHKLLQKYKDVEGIDERDKARKVISIMYDNECPTNLKRIYKLCWKHISNVIPDNETFN